MVGECVGNYQIVQPLGEGGMATVYLAVHPELRRRVAVKVMNPDLIRSDEMVQRFFNEARAASGIGHRGIVEVSDLGRLPSGAPYIVMELLEGESLADRMARVGRLPLPAAVEIAGQAADAMSAAHAHGIVHRDLKPENLYLVPDPMRPGVELVKVLDFGIAKLGQRPSDSSGMRTRTGAILGTPRYMSPEQCRESRDVDHRADVYSLGVVLYEMLAGAPPFVSSSWGELAHMHIGVEPPSLSVQVPDLPPTMAAVVHRALEKSPAARFQSMLDLKDAVDAANTIATAPVGHATGDEGQGRAPAPTPDGFAGAGATRRFGVEPGASGRGRRRRPTTLEEAASEVVRHPEKPGRAIPTGAVVALISLTAVAVVAAWLVAPRPAAAPAASENDPINTTTSAATPAEPVPAPRPAAPLGSPVIPEAAPPLPPAAEEPVAPTVRPPTEAVAGHASDRTAPARRRRRSVASPGPRGPAQPPATTPAPGGPARPREPFKI